MKPITQRVPGTNAIGIQSGESTHHQDQSMKFVSLRPMNRTVSIPAKLTLFRS